MGNFSWDLGGLSVVMGDFSMDVDGFVSNVSSFVRDVEEALIGIMRYCNGDVVVL